MRELRDYLEERLRIDSIMINESENEIRIDLLIDFMIDFDLIIRKRNEFIIIYQKFYDDDYNNSEEIEIFRISDIIFENDEKYMNRIILRFIRSIIKMMISNN